MKKFILFKIILLIIILAQFLYGYDNTQIVASNYCNISEKFYEAALPHPNTRYKWVKIYYKNRIAIVKINDVGPQNEYDNYWDAGTDNSGYNKRWMFQNLEQWMPAAEWVLSSTQGGVASKRQPIKHPEYLGKSDFYTEATGNEYYPDFTIGKRYAPGSLVQNSDPHIIENINDKRLWKSYNTNAGIDLSGGVWKHLDKKEWNNPNIRDVVKWEFYNGEPPGPEIKNISPAINSCISESKPTISMTIEDVNCGLDIDAVQINGKKSIASVKMYMSLQPGKEPVEVPAQWSRADDDTGFGIDKINLVYTPPNQLEAGIYNIKVIAKNNAGIETNLAYTLTIGLVLFQSAFEDPTNPDNNKYVVISNPQQTPTPALTEDMRPQYPTAYPTATVEIDTFIKGMMLGMTGGLDFSDTKYKEGYKAIGIAAYTLLLNEIKKNKRNNKGYDILVNGYSDKQRYYIPYIDFNSFSNNNVKNAINTAYNEIAVTMTAYDAGNTITQYYVKTFWPERVSKYVRDDGVEIPDYHPLVFPCVDGKGTTLIQSAIDEMGEYMAYLNTTRVEEDVGKNAPESLRNCTKAGMSAFGAMRYAEKGVPNSGEKVAENILKYFYRPAPVILKKVFIAQDGKKIYEKEWSGAYMKDGIGMRELDGGEVKNALPDKKIYMELYFSEKIAEGIMVLRSKAFPIGIPVLLSKLNSSIEMIEDDIKYPEIVKLTITAENFVKLAGSLTDETKTEDVIISVSCKDELTKNRIDAKPETVAYTMTDGADIYQQDKENSDENHHISIIVAQNTDPEKNGAGYGVTGVVEGGDVTNNIPTQNNIPMPEINIRGIGNIDIPRPYLSGAKWGFDGSKFAIVLFPDVGQYLSGWKFNAEMLQGSIGETFRGINGPKIVIPPIDTGVDLGGMVSQMIGDKDTLCGKMGNIFDKIENMIKYENGEEKKAYGGDIKVCASGAGANAVLDFMTNTNNAETISKIGGLSLTGLELGGVDVDAINVIMQAQDIANKMSIALAIISAIQMIPNPSFAAYLATGAIGYARSWGESTVKALTFQALDNLIKNNQGAVEELVRKLPGGSNFPGFGGSIDRGKIYENIFGCEAVTDFDKFWENIDWWNLAAQVAEYTSKFESNGDLKEDSSWLNDLKNRTADFKTLLSRIDKVQISGVAGKKGANMTIKSAALSLISEILGILKTIPEPITNSIANIGPIIVSVLNSTDGNLFGTLDSQLGIGTKIRSELENQGKALIKEVDVSNLPKLPIDLPVDFSMVPFMGDAFNEVIKSLSYGRGPQADPGKVLEEMDETGEICIFYPYKPNDPLVPFPNYNGWLTGITTDKAIIHVMGWASDFLPQYIQIYAQADNGPIVTTVLKIDTTLMTTADGKRGKADWELDVPLPHAGKNV